MCVHETVDVHTLTPVTGGLHPAKPLIQRDVVHHLRVEVVVALEAQQDGLVEWHEVVNDPRRRSRTRLDPIPPRMLTRKTRGLRLTGHVNMRLCTQCFSLIYGMSFFTSASVLYPFDT